MASTLKINTLTGVTTAGSIAVTGEGNSTTTNLQQGLCKAWLNVDNLSSFDTKDSFNLSSVADTGTAIITPSWTNAFNSANYVGNATSGDLSSGASSPKPYIGTYATGSYKYENAHSSHVDLA
jgi:hypothetical protein